MTERASLTIILLDGPYIAESGDIACKIADSALKKRHDVWLFLYMDGVHLPKKGQDPKAFPNLASRLEDLIERGLKVKACVRCASARGYLEEVKDGQFLTGAYIDGVKIVSILDLAEWISESAKVITLGG